MIDETPRPIHVTVDAMPGDEVGAGSEGIDLLALAVDFLSQWRLAVSVTTVVAVLCVAYVLRLKPQYVATATILPQEGRSSESTSSLFSIHGPGALYQGLLRSRTVQDLVIDRADLLRLYHVSDREVARGNLAATSSFGEGADGLMTVAVRDGDATQAAVIANAYLDALQQLNESMGLQQSTRTREFFEGQLQMERVQLAAAEDRYKQLQKQTGQILPEAQTSSALATITGTRQQISSLQVQRARLLQSETEQNPEVRALDSQIGTLEGQEARQENSASGAPVGAAPSAALALQQNLELQRAQREVAYYNSLVTSLGSEFESARMNEVAARSAFQIVDRAIPPENKAWPPRKPYFGISLAFAVLMGIAAVVLRLLALRVMAHAATRQRLQVLRGAFRQAR